MRARSRLASGRRPRTIAGAIGVFTNHREVQYEDPTYASEVVLFADLLLRMLDRVAEREW
jgi:hypothetical protein